MSTRVLFVGLDSADPALVARFEEEGLLPTITGLRRDARAFDLHNAMSTLAGAIWQEIWSGRSAARSGFYFPLYQFCSGELEPRPRGAREFDARAFWTEASGEGARVAVVDVPYGIACPGLNGVHVMQWGTHDRAFFDCRGHGGEPQELVDEIVRPYGVHPLWSESRKQPAIGSACDGIEDTLAEHEALLDAVIAGLEVNSALRLDVLGREDWDLFACGLAEYQCAGHHFWDFEQDSDHPRLHGALRDLYARLDETLGLVLDAAGNDATVMVLASHCHGPHIGGGQLLPEVLERLGMSSRIGAAASARRRIPAPVWNLARRIAPAGVKRSVHPPVFASPETQAMAVGIDHAGWIRLNLKGREPNGGVAPGAEADALLEELTEELLLLEQPQSGERIVERITRADSLGADLSPDIPDLFVNFREDIGLIESCRSPRVGLVEKEFPVPGHRRSSHRLGPSRLWVRGPGVAPGFDSSGNVLDIAPTVLTLLGVPTPDWMDGRPLSVA